ncbi:MAG TPA: hypothetical protein VHX64_15425 [Caulobacteraceae bacterium]|jgi:hypothetical protein|nr:hypothetical protein [Caulobacteraceae bacterium]
MKKIILGVAALILAAAPLAASAQPFGNGNHNGGYSQQRGNDNRGFDNRGGGRYDGYRGNGGGAVAAGVFGFVFGSILTHALEQPVAYQQQCWWQNEPVQGPYGRVHYEQVQVCR